MSQKKPQAGPIFSSTYIIPILSILHTFGDLTPTSRRNIRRKQGAKIVFSDFSFDF